MEQTSEAVVAGYEGRVMYTASDLLAPRTAAEESATESWLRKLDASDVLDECIDASEQLEAAMRSGDALLVGEIVMGVRQCLALRLAIIDLYERGTQALLTKQAVADVVSRHAQAAQLARQHLKASERRFTGEALTGFGGLSS